MSDPRNPHDERPGDERPGDEPNIDGTPSREPEADKSPNEDLPPLADHLRQRPDEPRRIAKARSQSRLVLLMLFAAIPLLVVFVVALGSLSKGPPSADPDPEGGGTSGGLAQVTRYCNYTARTEADFAPCLEKNRDRAFLQTDTNAARYARGDLDECLSDAGPRCTVR